MMKKNTLILTLLSIMLLGGVILSWMSNTIFVCDPMIRLCFHDDGRMILDDQSIVVAVETPNQRAWLLEQLAPHLENTNAVVSVIVRETTSAFAFANSPIDIAMVDKQAAGTLYPLLHRFDLDEVNPYFIDFASAHLEDINHNGVRFIPMIIDGPFFVMNTTILSRLGFDINDVDEVGRLNELNSFEAIMEASDRFRSARPLINNRRLTSMFPFTLVEPWSVYGFLTANGWGMYPDNDAFHPGFDDPLFLEMLELLEPILSHQWDLTGQNQKQWRYEQELIGLTAPFSIKVPWLNLEAISRSTRNTFVVTPLPTIGGMQPYSLAQVRGWVFKNSASPALRQLVMEKLTSFNYTQFLLLEDQEAVLVDPSRLDDFKMSDLQRQKIIAARYSVSPPLFALPQDQTVLGFDFYTDGDILTYLKALANQTMTPTQVQERIVHAFNRWAIQRTYYENRPNP